MIEQNNQPQNLAEQWINKKITLEQYFFRLKANEMNIKTFKYTSHAESN